MRRLILAVLIALTGFAPAYAQQQRPAEWSAQQKADLDRVSAYLNSIKTMRGGFTQIDANGQSVEANFISSNPAGCVSITIRRARPW